MKTRTLSLFIGEYTGGILPTVLKREESHENFFCGLFRAYDSYNPTHAIYYRRPTREGKESAYFLITCAAQFDAGLALK